MKQECELTAADKRRVIKEMLAPLLAVSTPHGRLR